jgi:DNA-binding transcriptional ArsR family regulator
MKTMAQPSRTSQPLTAEDRAAALDDIFGALSDPIRRSIVAQLTGGPRSVTQLGAPFDVSAPAISKHLAVLERSGLIVRWKIGRVHYCRLVADPLVKAGAWIEQHQAFWERQFDALADYLDREDDPCKPQPPKPQD